VQHQYRGGRTTFHTPDLRSPELNRSRSWWSNLARWQEDQGWQRAATRMNYQYLEPKLLKKNYNTVGSRIIIIHSSLRSLLSRRPGLAACGNKSRFRPTFRDHEYILLNGLQCQQSLKKHNPPEKCLKGTLNIQFILIKTTNLLKSVSHTQTF
jgi:hypothetical protein